MEKTIYNVFVPMENQEQCDRMKQLCIDNRLEFGKDNSAFIFDEINFNEFYYSNGEFYVLWNSGFPQITEKEFIELLKTTK